MFTISILIVLSSLTASRAYPCPPTCLCKPTDMPDVDFTKMSYTIDCTNSTLNNEQLVFAAEAWSKNVDLANNDDDDEDDPMSDYSIALDLSNCLSLKTFTNTTVQLSNFDFIIQGLSLTNEGRDFTLQVNSFNSPIFTNLKVLNLSSCCRRIPDECYEIFRPLKELQVLDLSGSNMYKTCLNTPGKFYFLRYTLCPLLNLGTISSKLADLILRNNAYESDSFSHSSQLFDGVRTIDGTLDLQNSRFSFGSQLYGNCLFDLFQSIKTLDLSSVEFESISNDTDIHLELLLKCKPQKNGTINGGQLINLYLRRLNLQRLPSWFQNERFPLLNTLDLSYNDIRTIDLQQFSKLQSISLAYNPLDLNKISWRDADVYESINLRSTRVNRTFNLYKRLKKLLKITKSIDYSENEPDSPTNITELELEIDFQTLQLSLNLSRTNLRRFNINAADVQQLDVSSNFLTELNLDQQTKLNYLDCSNQNLSKLTFNKDLFCLKELKCSNNSLTKIENFSQLRKETLKIIDLSNNNIDSLDELLANIDSRFLQTINLRSNSIQIISSRTFHKKLISLFEVNLSWNKIHTIRSYAFQAPNLQILDLTGNPLKLIEPNAVLTTSLRLFYITNDTQQLAERCEKTKSNDTLLFMYINWFERNGTLMKTNRVQFNKCLNRYRTNSITATTKHFIKRYIVYELIIIISIGVLLGGLYWYQKKGITIFAYFQRYKQLDRSSLVQNAAEMGELREDDDIVMNLEEPPFRS